MLRLFYLALMLLVPFSYAVAAGGGGSAGGSGAQHGINRGLYAKDGQPGPPGAVNNPRPFPAPAAPKAKPDGEGQR